VGLPRAHPERVDDRAIFRSLQDSVLLPASARGTLKLYRQRWQQLGGKAASTNVRLGRPGRNTVSGDPICRRTFPGPTRPDWVAPSRPTATARGLTIMGGDSALATTARSVIACDTQSAGLYSSARRVKRQRSCPRQIAAPPPPPALIIYE